MTRFRPIALVAVLLFARVAVTVVVLRSTGVGPDSGRDTAKLPAGTACDPPRPGAAPRPPECPQAAPPNAREP